MVYKTSSPSNSPAWYVYLNARLVSGAHLEDPPDPYAKLYLLPEKSKKSKRKTEVMAFSESLAVSQLSSCKNDLKVALSFPDRL